MLNELAVYFCRASGLCHRRKQRAALAIGAAVTLAIAGNARAYEVSSPAILQDFESTWQTIINRTPDIFAAGYGSVYTPPPGRAESGNQSVGYDVYNRYDFGSPGNPTLYGTQTGLQNMINSIHTMGGLSYIDLVWNQSGFADTSTSGFTAGGGYPGFALTLQTTNSSAYGYNTQGYTAVDGDYHSAYATGDQEERLAGLVDIAQESDNFFIRQPVTAGTDNIPGPTGTTGWNGFPLANVPTASNAQYYPEPGYSTQTFYDSELGQSFTRSSFNTSSPMSGVPTSENAMGYLQRYAQYMVQVMGADGFRVDAAKNMPEWVMDYLDVATYNASNRYLLNGSRENVFSFGEVYDSSDSLLESYVDKSIYSGGVANRDVEDYPLYFAMDSNLTSTGSNNNWYNVVSASIDCYDPSNGTQDLVPSGNTGVKFVSNQDVGAPALDSVAYAYILMMPGNAMVYYNGHNFGTESQRSFPDDGREDALGGTYGTALTTLLDLRNRYGRGNYQEDWIEQNNYAFERVGSALIMLSNATTPGFDSRTFNVSFAAGTPLVEQTGNAGGSFSDPNGDIPKLLVVQSGSSSNYVNARFLHNATYAKGGGSSYTTGDGYLVYGLPTPTGSISLTNVAQVLAGTTPSQSDSNIAYENGTDVVSNIDVIKSATFTVSLATTENNISGFGHWHNADGDSALIKVDGGIDVANNGTLVTSPSDVSYGFEPFATTNSPGYSANSGAGGNGSYSQIINTSQLGQGYHYITVIAYSHNADTSAPPVYTDWKQTIYVDTAPANSTIESFSPTSTASANRSLVAESVDGLANNIHVLLDVPPGYTSSQILAMIGSNNQPTQTDVNLWQENLTNVSSGNHVVTLVTYKPDGATTIQRFTENQYSFLSTSTTVGAGLGDLNDDGSFNSGDISTLTTVLQSNGQQFNAAADVNGDGVVNLEDTFLLGPIYSSHGTNLNAIGYNSLITSSTVTSGTFTVTGNDVIYGDTANITSVTAGKNLTASFVRGTLLSIPATSKVAITPNTNGVPSISKLSTLTIAGTTGAWTGQLDLGNNDLLFESTTANAATDLARLTNQITTGFDHAKWDGNGIIASSARADTTGLHTLGIISNNVGGTALYSTFDGQPADTNSILIKYTLAGDANLDGVVDGSDYTLLDTGYNNHLTGWFNGDFNYDGVINGNDYSLIDSSYNSENLSSSVSSTGATEMIATSTEQLSSSAVPEPTAIGLLGLGAFSLLKRNRKPTIASGNQTRSL